MAKSIDLSGLPDVYVKQGTVDPGGFPFTTTEIPETQKLLRHYFNETWTALIPVIGGLSEQRIIPWSDLEALDPGKYNLQVWDQSSGLKSNRMIEIKAKPLPTDPPADPPTADDILDDLLADLKPMVNDTAQPVEKTVVEIRNLLAAGVRLAQVFLDAGMKIDVRFIVDHQNYQGNLPPRPASIPEGEFELVGLIRPKPAPAETNQQ